VCQPQQSPGGFFLQVFSEVFLGCCSCLYVFIYITHNILKFPSVLSGVLSHLRACMAPGLTVGHDVSA
jgi:hypothetical protein